MTDKQINELERLLRVMTKQPYADLRVLCELTEQMLKEFRKIRKASGQNEEWD